MKCGDCRYFTMREEGEKDDFGDGDCHRYPPKSSNMQEDTGTVTELFLYPTVFSITDWCGEFQPKRKK